MFNICKKKGSQLNLRHDIIDNNNTSFTFNQQRQSTEWYGIPEFNVPLDTVLTFSSETGQSTEGITARNQRKFLEFAL